MLEIHACLWDFQFWRNIYIWPLTVHNIYAQLLELSAYLFSICTNVCIICGSSSQWLPDIYIDTYSDAKMETNPAWYIYWPDTNNQLIDNTVQMGTKMTYSYVCVALYHNDDVILGRNNITQPCEFGHIPVIGYCAAIRITSVAFQQVLHTSCCICCICWFAPCRSQARMKRWEVYHKIKYS